MNKIIRTLLFATIALPCSSYSQTDTSIGLNTPEKFGTDHQAIASSLCIDLSGDRAKANALYNWVTHNIAYDVEALKKFPKPTDDKAEKALKTKKAVCSGYSELYTQLCKDVGLQSVTIEGYAKDWIFDNGDQMYIPRHQWNAVKINGKWELVDATWGAGGLYMNPGWWRRLVLKVFYHNKMQAKDLKFRYRYDPQYFAQAPETFRLKHLPSDPLWQLTDTTMPLAIFESGDSAVRSFNELYSKPEQSNPQLDKIAELDEDKKVFEFADRAYAFNGRYHSIMSSKSVVRAKAVVDKAFTDSTVQNGDLMLKDAANDLKKSLEFIKLQKKAFPEEYNKLKMKNKAKGMEAKQHIRLIKTDDKRLIAESNKHIKSAENKQKRASKKFNDIQQRKRILNPGHIDEIETGKVHKKEGSPELYKIKDSVAARNKRIDAGMQATETIMADTRTLIRGGSLLLDSLATSLDMEDSMLIMEARERMSMHDSYDDEVKKWNQLFKTQKYQHTDTFIKYYFSTFDTVIVRFGKLQNTHLANLDMYKQNVRDLEQYKKWNNTDDNLKEEYTSTINDYLSAIDTASSDMKRYINYLDGNIKLFEMLNKQSNRQIKIVERMEKAEKNRQNMEAGSISRKRAFDVRENEQQRAAVQKGLKRVQYVVDKIDGVK